MSFYVFAWAASILYAAEAIAGKLTSKYSIKNPWLFNFFWALLILLFSIPFAVSHHAQLPAVWTPLILAGFFYCMGGTLYLLGLYYFDISAFAPLFNFRSVFAVILSALLLKEVLSFHQYLLILVIFGAGMVVTMDERFSLKSFFSWPILIILTDMVGLAFEGIFIQKAIVANGYWTVTLGVGIIMQILLMLTIPLFWREIKSLTTRSFIGIFWMSATGFLATLAANKAYSSNVGISSTIIGLPLSMLVAFTISILAPKLLEKHPSKVYIVRFGAAAVMFGAAILLSK